MKKIIALVLCVVSLLSLASCGISPIILEYSGVPLTSLTYKSVTHMSGYTKVYVFDFEKNEINIKKYFDLGNGELPEEEIIVFTEAEEKELINKLYTYRLFRIKDKYPAPPNTHDGGNWYLTIEFSDGSKKKSEGRNNSPSRVFERCSKAFFDLCGEGVTAYVPSEYYSPPSYSYSYSGVTQFHVLLGDYKWNGFESSGNDLYEMNVNNDNTVYFFSDEEHTFGIYTANNRDDKRFKKFTVTSYDFCEELTGEQLLYSSGYFSQMSIALEKGKLYLIRIEYANGDFSEHTFNTGRVK